MEEAVQILRGIARKYEAHAAGEGERKSLLDGLVGLEFLFFSNEKTFSTNLKVRFP